MLTLNSEYINDPEETYRVVNELRRAVINGIDNCGRDYERVLKFLVMFTTY